MNEWWEGLSTVLKVLYCIALPSTLLLLIQTLLAVIVGSHAGGAGFDVSDTSGIDFDGGGMHGGFDVHTDMSGVDLGHDLSLGHDVAGGHSVDGGNPSDLGTMHLFTFQTIVAFLTVFSWTTIVSINGGLPNGLAFGIGFAIGVIVMLAIAKIVQLSARLAENGTLDVRNCLGLTGTVYIPIPPKGQGEGKVNVTVQGQLRELTAVTAGEETIKTGTQVRVTDLRGDTVVVELED